MAKKAIWMSALVLALAGTSACAMSSGSRTNASPNGGNVTGRMAPIWVAKPDGTKQCEPGAPQPLEVGEEELKKAGIQVLRTKHTHDGKARIQLCGTPTGGLNAYEIPGELVEKALKLGFNKL